MPMTQKTQIQMFHPAVLDDAGVRVTLLLASEISRWLCCDGHQGNLSISGLSILEHCVLYRALLLLFDAHWEVTSQNHNKPTWGWLRCSLFLSLAKKKKRFQIPATKWNCSYELFFINLKYSDINWEMTWTWPSYIIA